MSDGSRFSDLLRPFSPTRNEFSWSPSRFVLETVLARFV
jgi:hypothetical protein